MKDIYDALLTRLSGQIPALKMIDFDMGQLGVLDLDLRPSVKFPCALIDITYPRCTDISGDIQLVESMIKIRLAFETPLPTDSNATKARRDAALLIFDTVDLVYKALQGYSAAGIFTELSRRSQVPDNRYAGIKIIEMIFDTTFEDITAYQA